MNCCRPCCGITWVIDPSNDFKKRPASAGRFFYEKEGIYLKLLVSTCLLGTPCRYDGTSKPHPTLKRLSELGHTLIPVCPEVLGGLPTPRAPAERQPDGRVLNRDGEDVTPAFQTGAQAVLALARKESCTLAVLKERSPSCGSRERYDGSFSRTLIPEPGVTAELLQASGITVLGESQVESYFSPGTQKKAK